MDVYQRARSRADACDPEVGDFLLCLYEAERSMLQEVPLWRTASCSLERHPRASRLHMSDGGGTIAAIGRRFGTVFPEAIASSLISVVAAIRRAGAGP